jgi:hypothetical protein
VNVEITRKDEAAQEGQDRARELKERAAALERQRQQTGD